MAATTDMGEVEETHHKQDDNVQEDTVLNGELKEDADEKSSQESEPDEEMLVDEEGQSKEDSSEIHGDCDDDSDTSKQDSVDKLNDVEKSDDERTNKDSASEVMLSENSADSVIHNVDDNTSSDSEETEGVEDQSESEDTLDSKITGKNGLDGVEHQLLKKNSAIVLNVHDSAETDDDSETDVELDEEDSFPKENGEIHRSPEPDKEAIIDLDTPVKKDQIAIRKDLTPRRSSRNASRSTSYINQEGHSSSSDEESDIEEVMPDDPLGDKIVKKVSQPPSTIVVKDTKRLVEIASKSTNQNASHTSTGKKEPTLVIIDTNSILSGRGPIPIAHKSSLSQSSTSHYNTLTGLPAQGIYPPNMRATITPIPTPKHQQQQISTPILPSLTDDMFVVEAPSFIVPYVYEKPPVNDLRKYVDVMKADLTKALEEQQRKKVEEARKKKEARDDDDDTETDDECDDEKKSDSTDKEGKSSPDVVLVKETKKSHLFFDSPIGKFFVDIGVGLVQEFVQTDLLKQQKRKRDREQGSNHETNRTIQSLIKNLEFSRENNEPFHMTIKKCDFCNYKTESALAMQYHLETPHMKNYVYKCNFCPYEVRSPHDILLHMEAEHCLRGRLERAPAFHQCPSCPFEDNQKGKLSRHLIACARKFKPERNLEPPLDWEPPAKIPRIPRLKPNILSGSLNTSTSAAAAAAAMYQAMAKAGQYHLLPKMQGITGATSPSNATLQAAAVAIQQQHAALNRGRGRPSLGHTPKQSITQHIIRAGQTSVSPGGSAGGMVFKQTMSGGSVLLPAAYQLGGTAGNQLYQSPSNKKSNHQPSISITPLPRGSGNVGNSASGSTSSGGMSNLKPGDSASGKSSFVICEICDGYIKDLEQLRNHMQWIHKVKIHPKMIYNRPPLNCQKCQFRFFTDQGLERHLLGSHGLVTSSMQEAANINKDSGRCPVCGRVFQWKLLNHVARDHNMTLKPAHLSYKCTVCTATFGMYKQFENHVYSAHSVVAKRVMDKKQQAAQQAAAASKQLGSPGESILKPLKINDEITIIPQMPKSTTITSSGGGGGGGGGGGNSSSSNSANGTSAAIMSKNAVKLNQVVAAATAAAAAVARQQAAAAHASSSKGSEMANTALSRAERLVRRKTSITGEN